MSRLERHRQKKILFYSGILFVLIIFFIFVGLPFFISSSVFISNLFGGKKDNSTNIAKAFRDISIAEIPEATNSASFLVAGTLDSYDSLDFYLNSEKVSSQDVKGENSFSKEISGLRDGENRFYIIARVSKSSENKKTDTYIIVYKSGKPKLNISEPSDNAKTNRTEIKVAGSTDKDVEIKINGGPVVVDANGNFQAQIKLNNGDNKIIVTALDSAGNQEEKTLTVNYSSDN